LEGYDTILPMELTADQIKEKLKKVIDPELGINIVDLGLIYDVKVNTEEGKHPIDVTMTLTTPGCPLGTTIIRMVRDALADIPGLNPERDVDVIITFDPPWLIEMMTEEARAELGF
jgi:metal-sulfur cluster biosynthetic enzyme